MTRKAIVKKQTKMQILSAIVEDTGLAKKDVNAVFESLAGLVQAHMKKRGSGEFAIPAVGVKITRKKKPATKAREGRNPMTGEAVMIPAKKARNVIKVSALKVLKETLEA